MGTMNNNTSAIRMMNRVPSNPWSCRFISINIFTHMEVNRIRPCNRTVKLHVVVNAFGKVNNQLVMGVLQEAGTAYQSSPRIFMSYYASLRS